LGVSLIEGVLGLSLALRCSDGNRGQGWEEAFVTWGSLRTGQAIVEAGLRPRSAGFFKVLVQVESCPSHVALRVTYGDEQQIPPASLSLWRRNDNLEGIDRESGLREFLQAVWFRSSALLCNTTFPRALRSDAFAKRASGSNALRSGRADRIVRVFGILETEP
jgi:hypothetical protein